MTMSLAQTTKAALYALGKHPTHALGQNFLIDEQVLHNILELAQVGEEDVVEEIGPGLGTLTAHLVERAHAVVAIEADAALAQYIQATYPAACVIHSDALAVSTADIAACLAQAGVRQAPNKLVANLPYHIAATVVLDAFSQNAALACATVMVQKEVAERMGALPGTKAYGAYTAKLALYAKKAGSFDVPPSAFMPQPHVTSTVIQLVRTHAPDAAFSAVTTLINQAFAQRRKTLWNNLRAAGYAQSEIACAFTVCELPEDIRAERLDCNDFIALRKALS